MTDFRAETTVASVGPVSPHNRALYEAGKKLLVDSIEVGREFCKFMIGTSSGAVAVYLGLLEFVLPKDYAPSTRQGFLFAIAPVLFLLSSIVFAIGYFPTKGRLSLDLPDDIERERSSSIERRRQFAFWGFLLFSIASFVSVGVTLWGIGVKRLPKP